MKTNVESKRKLLGLTQEEVADKVGIGRQYYNKIENGHVEPSVSVAKSIAAVLGVEWTIFFVK